MTATQIYQAFEAHVRQIKGDNVFGRSRFNAEHSSLRSLFRQLNQQLFVGPATPLDRNAVMAELSRRSPKDHRKYLPAVEELCRKWPNGDYGTVHAISGPVISSEPMTRFRRVEPKAMTTSRADEHIWSRIEITDLPTDTPGVYHHTKNDFKTNTQKATASGQVKAKNIEGVDPQKMLERPEYWNSLGRMVLVSNAARCYGCAAAVVYTYCYENRHPDLKIDVVGNETYDHHFVVIGRENEDVRDVENWGDNAFVIDVWHSNLNDQKTPAVMSPRDCQYVGDGSSLRAFCTIDPTWREYSHWYAQDLGEFPSGKKTVTASQAEPIILSETPQQNTVPVVPSASRTQQPFNPLMAELSGRLQQRGNNNNV